MHRVVINGVVQLGLAAVRYLLTLYAFARVSTETVGQLSLVLTFVTGATFVAGFELHQNLNRPLLLGEHGKIRGVAFRAVLGSLTLVAFAFLFPLAAGFKISFSIILLIFMTALVEYFSLEFGRLLIIRGAYLTVTSLGALRALAPFLPGVVHPLTLESCLVSWSLVSLACAAIQLRIIMADPTLTRSLEPLTRLDLQRTVRFFAIGGLAALMPFVERLTISRLFGVDALGVFALLIIFVGVGDLLMQGLVWQPFIREIARRLAAPESWRATAAVLLAAIVSIFGSIWVGLSLLADFIFAVLNKPTPGAALIAAVLGYGAARATFTICFQLYYANHAERLLPYLQIGIAAAVLLSYQMGAALGLTLTGVLTLAAGMWIAFPSMALLFRLPHQLRKQEA